MQLTAAPAPVAPEVIVYSLTDTDGDVSSTSLTLNVVSNQIAGGATADNLAGTSGNDAIAGLDGNDTLAGAGGHDILTGGAGNDLLDGGADNDVLSGDLGNDSLVGGTGADILRGDEGADVLDGGLGADLLEGGIGIDTLTGSDGDDTLSGGTGNDQLSGGSGLFADVFRWELSDTGDFGTPAVDTITDFNAAAAPSGGDVLDLRDLLSGEGHVAGVGNLALFLHFEKSGADTIVHVSSTGGFAGGFQEAREDQTVVLQGVDLIGGMSTDQQVIQDLLNKGKLITD